jgi:hypothetical protein
LEILNSCAKKGEQQRQDAEDKKDKQNWAFVHYVKIKRSTEAD